MLTGPEVNLLTAERARLLTVPPVKHVTVHTKSAGRLRGADAYKRGGER